MFCSKCGTKVAEGTKFCQNCGTSVSSIEEGTVLTMQEPDAVENSFPAEDNMSTILLADDINDISPRKKKKVLLPVIAAIIVVCAIGFLFKDAVLAAFAPRFYAQNALLNTIEKIAEETRTANKNIFGFDIDGAKELSASVKAEFDKIGDYDLNGLGVSFSSSASDKKEKLMYSGELLYDGDSIMSILAMLDNENIYFDVPELFDESISMPSKEFGKAWNDSDLADESGIEFDEDLDLSYKNLTKNDELFTKETQKALEKNTIEFIKTAEIDISKGNASVNGKSVNTREVTITVDPGDIEDYLVETIDIIEDDENLKDSISSAVISSAAADEIDEVFSQLRDGIEEVCGYIDDTTIVMDVYRGNVVCFSVETQVEEAEIRAEIAFGDSKTLINDISALLEIEAEGEKHSVEITSTGNHIGKGNTYTDETTVDIKIPYEDRMSFEHTLNLDMKKKVYEQELEFSSDDESGRISLEGTCSNKKEFKLTIDEVEFIDNGDDYKIKGSFEIAVSPKVKFDKVNTKDSLNILEADEDDLMDWAEDVENNATDWAEDNEKLYELFGYGSSYDDYYYYDDYYDDYDYDYDDYDYDDYYYDDYDDYYYN